MRLVSGCVLFLLIINIAPTYEHSGKSSVKKVRAPDLKKKKKKEGGEKNGTEKGKTRRQSQGRAGCDVTGGARKAASVQQAWRGRDSMTEERFQYSAKAISTSTLHGSPDSCSVSQEAARIFCRDTVVHRAPGIARVLRTKAEKGLSLGDDGRHRRKSQREPPGGALIRCGPTGFLWR